MVNVQTKVAPSIIGGNTRPSSICVFCPLLQHKADEIYERLTERVNGVAYTYLVAPVLFVDLLDTGLERMRPFTLYTSLGSRVFLSLPLKRSRTRCQYPINCGGLSFRQWWWTPPHSPPSLPACIARSTALVSAAWRRWLVVILPRCHSVQTALYSVFLYCHRHIIVSASSAKTTQWP